MRTANEKASSIEGVSWQFWVFMILAVAITFVSFLLLDPRPNLLLATCSAFNMGIMLWAIARLYQMRLLLSPMAAVMIGPAWIVQYSVGNLMARIAGELRFGSNPGSLEYYPVASLLTAIGLSLFCLVCFGFLKKHIQYYRIRYEDLTWQPWQALTSSLLAVAVLAYLSIKYEFVGGYFRNIEGQFDAGLAASSNFFIVLALTIGVSVMLKAKNGVSALMGFSGVVLPLLIALGLRSRTFMIAEVITMALCWLTIKPQHVRSVLVIAFIGGLTVYLFGSVVKVAGMRDGGTISIVENFRILSNVNIDTIREINYVTSSLDAEYHLAGLEFPAALLSGISRGASPIYGEPFLGGAFAGLPRFLRPANIDSSERLVIYKAFYGKGLYYGDSIGIPLTSGIAAWGLLGPLIYIIIGVYCVLLWHVAQSSPRIFVTYLIVGAGIGDLFWDNVFFVIRAFAFAWAILFITSKLIMPEYSSRDGAVEKNVRSIGLARRMNRFK